MKVENRPGAAPERLSARRDADVGRVEKGPARDEQDRVQLSTLARSLPRLVEELGDVGAVDTPRVQELRARLAQGDYAPANEEVARSLLRGIVDEET